MSHTGKYCIPPDENCLFHFFIVPLEEQNVIFFYHINNRSVNFNDIFE